MKANKNNVSKAHLPEVLMTYLSHLVDAESSIRRIRLTPGKLGKGTVQDIVCETAETSVVRRVFGFPPVEACIEGGITHIKWSWRLSEGGAGHREAAASCATGTHQAQRGHS